MNIKWTLPIATDNFVFWDFLCRPICFQGRLFYAVRSFDNDVENGFNIQSIYVLEIDKTGNLINLNKIKLDEDVSPVENLKASIHWVFRIFNCELCLFVGFWLVLKENGLKRIHLEEVPESFEVNSGYEFGDYLIHYNRLSSIECLSKAKNIGLWKKKIKGYLYTEIELKNGFLHFGTAGRGGAFYSINLNTGEILIEFVNQNASQFIELNGGLFLRSMKGKLVHLNMDNGEIFHEIALPGKLFYAPFATFGNDLITTSYNEKTRQAHITCVSLNN